jgi:hypothetical protein
MAEYAQKTPQFWTSLSLNMIRDSLEYDRERQIADALNSVQQRRQQRRIKPATTPLFMQLNQPAGKRLRSLFKTILQRYNVNGTLTITSLDDSTFRNTWLNEIAPLLQHMNINVQSQLDNVPFMVSSVHSSDQSNNVSLLQHIVAQALSTTLHRNSVELSLLDILRILDYWVNVLTLANQGALSSDDAAFVQRYKIYTIWSSEHRRGGSVEAVGVDIGDNTLLPHDLIGLMIVDTQGQFPVDSLENTTQYGRDVLGLPLTQPRHKRQFVVETIALRRQSLSLTIYGQSDDIQSGDVMLMPIYDMLVYAWIDQLDHQGQQHHHHRSFNDNDIDDDGDVLFTETLFPLGGGSDNDDDDNSSDGPIHSNIVAKLNQYLKFQRYFEQNRHTFTSDPSMLHFTANTRPYDFSQQHQRGMMVRPYPTAMDLFSFILQRYWTLVSQ